MDGLPRAEAHWAWGLQHVDDEEEEEKSPRDWKYVLIPEQLLIQKTRIQVFLLDPGPDLSFSK